jgi:hypothetical protein
MRISLYEAGGPVSPEDYRSHRQSVGGGLSHRLVSLQDMIYLCYLRI